MKKNFKVFACIIVVLILVISTYQVVCQTRQSQSATLIENFPPNVVYEIPDSINLVLKKSCTPCHSGGNPMASSHLNISKWAEYSSEEQKKKGTAICETITSGDMPPTKVRKSKPEMIPKANQITLICNWTKSLSGGK